MKIAGIICECNPYHEGHGYLISKAVSGGADCIVCVMSGYFTQRGEAAILPSLTRAKMLLNGGADAVLELPFPLCCAGAEFFASAGVSVLDRLGVDELWFGSECGDIRRLSRVAELTDRETFRESYRLACKESRSGTAEAYFRCLRELGESETGFLPNDILGIAYLKALSRRNSHIIPRTVRRVGDGYGTTAVTEGQIPSASALRTLLSQQGAEAWEKYLPEASMEAVRTDIGNGWAPASLKEAERCILAGLRLLPAQSIERVPELRGGLGRRLKIASQKAESLEELLRLSATKKYTESRIRRGILFALTGTTDVDLRREPAYVQLLAANKKGCKFLAHCREKSDLNVVTVRSGIPKNEEAKRQDACARAAISLYTLCLKDPKSTGQLLRQTPWIEK